MGNYEYYWDKFFKIKNFKQEIEDKNNQVEILELENIITEIKTQLMDPKEEREKITSKPEDRIKEITQFKKHKKT